MKRVTAFLTSAIFVLCSISLPALANDTIAIIGTGDLGDSFGPRFSALGYRVVYGSRNPDSERVQDLVARTGRYCFVGDSLAGYGDGRQKSW